MHRVVMASCLLISLLSAGCAGLTVPKGELQTFEVIISERVNTSDIPKGTLRSLASRYMMQILNVQIVDEQIKLVPNGSESEIAEALNSGKIDYALVSSFYLPKSEKNRLKLKSRYFDFGTEEYIFIHR